MIKCLTIILMCYLLIIVLTNRLATIVGKSIILTLLGSILLMSIVNSFKPSDAEVICKQNAISYDFVKTVADITGKDELALAYQFIPAAEHEEDLDIAIMYIVPDISDADLDEILFAASK